LGTGIEFTGGGFNTTNGPSTDVGFGSGGTGGGTPIFNPVPSKISLPALAPFTIIDGVDD
ncbi:MAG: hypothetical protein AAF304_07905, partial [Pseudomonadota bacterium]